MATNGPLSVAAAVAAAAALLIAQRAEPASAQSPNQYRTGSGRPGPAYWQQRADYRIDATLDVVRNRIDGRETITYTNNSPTALTYIYMHVEQNICAPNSVTNVLNQPPLQFQDAVFDFSCRGFNGGLNLTSLKSMGLDLAHTIDGTVMKVMLPAPLQTGAHIQIDATWNFDIPPYGAGRMGRDGTLYEIAQWYPRVAVFDDIKGWNTEAYIGAGEFYLEYGSFDVGITLPRSYVVAATGVLQNPDVVLTVKQRERFAQAHTSNTPVEIIGDVEASIDPLPAGTYHFSDWSAQASTVKTIVPDSVDPPRTWRFHADSVRDFAFAAGNHLRWDAVNYDGILVQVFYRRNADKWAAEGINVARHAIKYFSEHWLRYPYPQASTVEGPIEGMEYPMLTFVPNNKVREDFQWTLMHEFGHQWYPMVVGSNERLYPWMDEGFNTYIDLAAAADYFKGTPYGDSIQDNVLHQHAAHAIPGEQPLMTPPVQSHDLFWTGYRKPALMMRMLREEVLGAQKFDDAFREYTRAWAFKHPAPTDFMRLMADASGRDLDWFWRDWLFTTASLDQAVESVTTDSAGSVVHLKNKGSMIMPAELRLTFDDNTTSVVRLPVEMWNLGASFDYRVRGSKRIRRAEIDARRTLPDTDRSNNEWHR